MNSTPDQALDFRHLGRSRPRGQGVDTEQYDTKYQNAILASSLRDEDRKLSAAQAHAQDNGGGLSACVAGLVHPTLHDGNHRPRESMTTAAISQNQALGRPRRPTTESRIRPSDEDYS
jgi:hypothetical protein